MSEATLGDVEHVVHTIATSRSRTRSTSATSMRSSATATSAIRWPAGSSWCSGLGRLRPHRHRHLPEEGRRHDHQPDRRHVRPDLGHRVPAGRDDRGGRDRADRRPDRRHAPGRDRGDQGPRAPTSGTRRCWTRSCRPPTSIERSVADGLRRAEHAAGGGRGWRGRRRKRPARWRPSAAGPATPASAASAPWTPGPWPSR